MISTVEEGDVCISALIVLAEIDKIFTSVNRVNIKYPFARVFYACLKVNLSEKRIMLMYLFNLYLI